MEILITLSTEDFDIIEDHQDVLSKEILQFKILENYFEVIDPEMCIGDPMQFEFMEVRMQIDSYNNLWALAKFVQSFKLTGRFAI